ncbi:MAG TPA: hypothetical protein VGZ02_08565 [Candidatus Baltobacteraceae bacterium]|jgi:hypothetical protein|nr:hypothetical protein [Candidatus Baltobacteraceae bacterium]
MGIMVFSTLRAALSAGFEPYERTADGYLVRTRMARGWAFAIALAAP